MDLGEIAPAVTLRAARWAEAGVRWTVGPVDPNHGNAIVVSQFESPTWLGDFLVWETGEADLSFVRVSDCWIVNKHYVLTSREDIEAALEEIRTVLTVGSAPRGALTYHEISPQ